MEAMDATSCGLHPMYAENHVARGEIACNRVFTLTLYVVFWCSSLFVTSLKGKGWVEIFTCVQSATSPLGAS